MTPPTMWSPPNLPMGGGAPFAPPHLPPPPRPSHTDYQLPCSLEELRELAEDFAQIEYAQGPGQNERMRETKDIEENKRRKKKRSAYITRFRQKHYENLLERRVAVSENEMRVASDVKKDLMGCNGQLKEQLMMLEKMVGMHGGLEGTVKSETNAETVVANVVATEEAADLVNATGDWNVGFGTATSTESDTDGTVDTDWMNLTSSNDRADVETQTSNGSTDLTSMDTTTQDDVRNMFSDELYTKPSYEAFAMDDPAAPFMNQDFSNLVAVLAKAA